MKERESFCCTGRQPRQHQLPPPTQQPPQLELWDAHLAGSQSHSALAMERNRKFSAKIVLYQDLALS